MGARVDGPAYSASSLQFGASYTGNLTWALLAGTSEPSSTAVITHGSRPLSASTYMQDCAAARDTQGKPAHSSRLHIHHTPAYCPQIVGPLYPRQQTPSAVPPQAAAGSGRATTDRFAVASMLLSEHEEPVASIGWMVRTHHLPPLYLSLFLTHTHACIHSRPYRTSLFAAF